MTVITARDFRANQTKYIGMAFNGEDVVLSTRAGRVKLTPQYDDNVITPELQAKIDQARKEWREGKCLSLKTHEEIDAYFNSL
jgi:hypothetical protein